MKRKKVRESLESREEEPIDSRERVGREELPEHRKVEMKSFSDVCDSVDDANLRDSSTSTLTLEAAFERLVKTLLTFFSSLAVSVNLQSRAHSGVISRFHGLPEISLSLFLVHITPHVDIDEIQFFFPLTFFLIIVLHYFAPDPDIFSEFPQRDP